MPRHPSHSPVSGLIRALHAAKNPSKQKVLQRFFKTGRGEYGEGDVFLGITVPVQRALAYRYLGLKARDSKKLLASPIHEFRFTALEILVAQYERASSLKKRKIAELYLAQTRRVNNWDLVDTSAPYILGHFAYYEKKDSLLLRLARSNNFWERRIAIVATFFFIQKESYALTMRIAALLIRDQCDLIQKACGWMLREVGKRSPETLHVFLCKEAHRMPAIMLRYACERMTKNEKERYRLLRASGYLPS